MTSGEIEERDGAPGATGPSPGSARILVIDDEEDIRAVLHEVLAAAGHHVLLAANGSDGLDVLRRSPADLVITDIFMPQKEGIETIMELREKFPSVKILAISGGGTLGRLDYLSAAQEFGAIGTVSKPFDCRTLQTAVSEVLAS